LKFPQSYTKSLGTKTLKDYSDHDFKVFLPPRPDNAAVGDVWAFDVRRMLPFLRQFHPGATVSLSGQQGAYACLRAVSPEYYEIVFQFHADFNLEVEEGFQGDLIDAVQRELTDEIAAVQRESTHEIGELQRELTDETNLANIEKELAETVAALKGLSRDLETRLNELKATITALEDIVSNLESRLDELEKTLTTHFDARLRELETELTANLASRLDALETELTEKLKGTQVYNEGIYLKPKQFTGRLLISKDGKKIKAFTIKCPPHEGNATLFVFGDTETVSMPRMEIVLSGVEETAITWTDAITAEQADAALREKFADRKSRGMDSDD